MKKKIIVSSIIFMLMFIFENNVFADVFVQPYVYSKYNNATKSNTSNTMQNNTLNTTNDLYLEDSSSPLGYIIICGVAIVIGISTYLIIKNNKGDCKNEEIKKNK